MVLTFPRRAVALVLVLLAAPVLAQDPEPQEKTLYVSSQESYKPGFAVGNIAIADPEIADYKVLAGRRELLLYGKAPGTTTLIIWDQRNVKRAVFTITVVTRESEQTEKELTELVSDFPGVKVRRLKGELVLVGTVSTRAELDAVDKIASAANASNLVRVATAGGGAQPSGGTSSGGAATAMPPSNSGDDSGAAVQRPTPPTIKYDIEVLEASVNYSSGSYATGVEPSGRPLYRTTLSVQSGASGTVEIPGAALQAPTFGAKDAKKKKKSKDDPAAAAPPTSLKLTLHPSELDESGGFTTSILVETNVPVEGANDPTVVRRARWEIPIQSTEPFGLAGAELLAMPVIEQGQSKVSRTLGVASVVGGLPGVSSAPGVGYVGAVPYYSKDRKTQLLAMFHPHVVSSAK